MALEMVMMMVVVVAMKGMLMMMAMVMMVMVMMPLVVVAESCYHDGSAAVGKPKAGTIPDKRAAVPARAASWQQQLHPHLPVPRAVAAEGACATAGNNELGGRTGAPAGGDGRRPGQPASPRGSSEPGDRRTPAAARPAHHRRVRLEAGPRAAAGSRRGEQSPAAASSVPGASAAPPLLTCRGDAASLHGRAPASPRRLAHGARCSCLLIRRLRLPDSRRPTTTQATCHFAAPEA